MLHKITFPRLRVCWILFAILTLCSARSYAADGDEFSYGGIKYKVISESSKTCKTVQNNSALSGNIVLPSSVPKIYSKSYTLVEIGPSSFSGCRSLTSVTIPNSVTSIGGWAFSGCSSLTSVTIPNSVTIIGSSAFEDCSSLTSVAIPNSVTSIGECAFYGCSSLTSVTIPNSVTSIGGSAFSGCSSLTSVTIPNSVTSIGWWAFYGCSSLNSILVEQGSQYFSSDGVALYNAEKTTLIAVPGGTITFTIPNSVTSIGDYAFEDCSSLTSITIPNSVTSIGDYAFSGCSSLTSLAIPYKVAAINFRTFEYCNLNPLLIMGIPSVDSDSFSGLSGRIECGEGQVEEIKKYTSLPVTARGKILVNPLIAGAKVSLTVNPEDVVDDADYTITLYNSNGGEVSSMPIAIGQEILISGLKIGTEYRMALSSRDANGQYWTYFERRFKTKMPRFNAEK